MISLSRAATLIAVIMITSSLSMAWAEPASEKSQTPASKNILIVPNADYAIVRDELLESIAMDGLTAPVISQFSNMLDNTAGSLGHPKGLYLRAEIFTFCSALVAATLVTESPSNIALCPLSIAIYVLPADPAQVAIAWRQPDTGSAGGQMASDALSRIANRVVEALTN